MEKDNFHISANPRHVPNDFGVLRKISLAVMSIPNVWITI